jgi:hypothetical protein
VRLLLCLLLGLFIVLDSMLGSVFLEGRIILDHESTVEYKVVSFILQAIFMVII